MEEEQIVVAAKCLPNKKALADVYEAGLTAVELYLNPHILENRKEAMAACAAFPLRYAVHAPVSGYDPQGLRAFADAVCADVVVCHNIYWEDEWKTLFDIFQGCRAKICVENTFSAHEPVKFMRRYQAGRCLDLEHLEMECAGIFEDPFVKVMSEASHIHMTGYIYHSRLWHTHLHHSPEHGRYLLGLLKRSGYSGLVVSEADEKFQTLKEFQALNDFYQRWRNDNETMV